MRKLTVTVVLAAAAVTPATAVAKRAPARPMAVVHAYDAYGVPPADLAEAKSDVRRIFARAGIGVVWVDCVGPASADSCRRGPRSNELIVRFVRSADDGAHRTWAMGDAMIGRETEAGVLLTIYPELVRRLADTANDHQRLLGRVIAHEIGHLLLGSTGHSNRGLMRSFWTTADVSRGCPFDWLFTPEEGSRMRERLTTRADSWDVS